MASNVGRGGGHSPANVTKNLKGIDFPAQKDDLIKHAQHNKAERVVIEEIQKMEEREYNSMADVMKAFGHEGGRSGGEESGGRSSSSSSRSGGSSSKSTSSHKPSSSHKK